jgi:hypothetical protein
MNIPEDIVIYWKCPYCRNKNHIKYEKIKGQVIWNYAVDFL